MNLRWDDLKLFLAVCEQGSLSGAARKLKLGQPTLSRRIGELEESVGEALFSRQSHGTSLTEAGQKLLPAIESMAEWANEAESNIKKQTYLPEGKVRIAAPPGIAYEFVAPLAVKIRQQYPDIQIEVMSAIENLNLGRGEADLALRSEQPIDTDLVCMGKISSLMRVYTSEDYAANLTSTPSIADLDWICWATPYDEMRTNQELRSLIPDFKPAFASDDFIVQLAACKAGIGAMILPKILDTYANCRQLHMLDIDLGERAVGSLHLVCHKRHRYLPKVQLVMEFILNEFEALSVVD